MKTSRIPIDVEVEKFEKTKLQLELDKTFGFEPRKIIEDVVDTYYKYMYEYGNTNIRVICNELQPQTYKHANEEIQIINT